jgi:pyruvate dehydrogenase E2 component (dihydrolipoamide acetyltransferase)
MAEQILMPRQGNTVESCVILEWRKQEGDTIAEGDVICEVETDKATFEVESTTAGSLLKIFFSDGDDVPVLTPIAVVGNAGEDISGMGPAGSDGAATPAAAAAPSATTPADAAVPAPQIARTEGERIAASPRARGLAGRKGVDLGTLAGGSGPGGRILERDVQAYIDSGQPLTPAATAKMSEGGLSAPTAGSGIGGRVTAADLVAAGTPVEVAAGQSDYPGVTREYEVKGVRKIIAEKMLASLQTTAQLTMHASADARSILAYRKKLKNSPEELGLRGITINDLVLHAAVRTLTRYPALNAHFLGDRIVEFSSVHAAFAVDTDRGLMVPVVRFAERMTLRQLAAATKRLSTECIEGAVNPDDLSGGTITVSNLGALGIEMFTPVLNPPQTAILGVSTIQPKAVIEGDETRFHPHIGLSLTINHQAVDGAPAAHFLKDLCAMVAGFELSLAG